MFEFLIGLNRQVNEFIWGPVIVGTIIAVGLYLTIGNRFVQFLKVKDVFKEIIGKRKEGEGIISPFKAFTVAVSGTVGVGNIAGVATAINLGGPGAVFWMWISGLVGMATKFSEVVLAIKYRVEKPDGSYIGGPMVYIEKGLGKKFKFLAVLFSIFGMVAAFGIGNMVQANSVAHGFSLIGVERLLTGMILVFIVGIVTIGGIKRIAQVASLLVPFMCTFYVVTGLIVIAIRIFDLHKVFELIFRSAFSGHAAVGGFLGVTIKEAIRYGFARGVFSNEAGLGSAPIAHSTAITTHPVKQAFWGIFEVFIDTILICSITAFVILLSGIWISGKTGIELTILAFESFFGKFIGKLIVIICVLLVAYSTILAWCYYGETCSSYLFGLKVRELYRMIWLPFILIGSLLELKVVWDISDTLNGLMIIPNLIALVGLSPVVFKLYEDFFKS